MTQQNVTVRIEPELVDWFRTEAGMSLSETVTQGLEELRQRQLSAQIQRELEETEALVSQQDKDYWADLAATDA